MLNRKTYIGVAIIIIICLFMIGLVWWWYGKKIEQLDRIQSAGKSGFENTQYQIITELRANETYVRLEK